MSKKSLKFHYSSARWPNRTICGKAVGVSTGSPLNEDGSVNPERVDTEEVDCKTCLKGEPSGN